MDEEKRDYIKQGIKYRFYSQYKQVVVIIQVKSHSGYSRILYYYYTLYILSILYIIRTLFILYTLYIYIIFKELINQ